MVDLEWYPGTGASLSRYEALSSHIQEWQLAHSPEFLSTLELEDFLKTVPEDTVVTIDL